MTTAMSRLVQSPAKIRWTLACLAVWALVPALPPSVHATEIFGAPDATRGFTGRVVGGEEVTDQSRNPGAVALSTTSLPFACSAARIAPGWVLTARHCTELKPALAHVFTNSVHYGKGPQTSVLRTLIAPEGDVALLEIDPNAPGPVVPWSSAPLAVGDKARVYGWGKTYTDAPEVSPVLKTAVGTVTGTRQSPFYPGPEYIVAGENGAPYFGDSGGPLVNMAGAVVGVVSWGPLEADPANSGHYGMLHGNEAWITQNTGANPRN